ncbi:hypothetical protein P9112_005723 [Eukaryota sp. TZLM1-RC]
MEESPSSPIICAPVIPSISSTEVREEGQQNPSTPSTELLLETKFSTTPFSEVPVAGFPNTSAPTMVVVTEVRPTPPAPSSTIPTRGVIHIPPTTGQTPQQGQVVFSAPAAWQVLSAPQLNTYQAPI